MTASITGDLAAAYAARHQGQAAVQAADVAVNRGFGPYIERALRVALHEGEDFTAETVRTYAANLAHGEGRDFTPADNLIPAFIGSLARHGRIREVGRVTSTRPERRGSKISLWRATSPAPAPTVSGRPPGRHTRLRATCPRPVLSGSRAGATDIQEKAGSRLPLPAESGSTTTSKEILP